MTKLKLLLISIGKQTATVMFPCPYCEISLTDLRNKDPEALEIPSQEIEALTFGHLIKDLNKFEQVHKGNKSEATFCGSMINPSPLKENDAIRFLDKCPPDELHLLEGFVNHSFFKGIVPILGYNPATKWPTNLGIVSKDYHGEVFEGNACRKLLKTPEHLRDTEVLVEVDKGFVEPFISLFQTMDKLVTSCFHAGKIKNDVNIPELIQSLITDYKMTVLIVTLKVHIIFHHLVPCLLNLGGRGLGLYSCQSMEGNHREFYQYYWQKYQVNSLENENYHTNLFKAVVEFSSKHM